MPKFKVTATMDVGYELIVEANNEAEAWRMAEDEDADWLQVDEGHDWTLENVYEVDKVTDNAECNTLS